MGWYWISLSPFLGRIANTLNSQRYISEVLESVVLPYLQGLATAIFQQDNARPHVADIVQSFFFSHQIELLHWLARSPESFADRKHVVHVFSTIYPSDSQSFTNDDTIFNPNKNNDVLMQ
ncbi:uncharacterized protein TNCV_1928451 [Trichonephila clavipes]|nr:uncharacterized protein TNCV_1928451 [Trichonephila clavipes]